MSWLKKVKQKLPKTPLIELIECDPTKIQSTKYNEFSQWCIMKSNIGDNLTDLRNRISEFYKLANDKNKTSVDQGFKNLYQCIFNIEQNVKYSIEGLKILQTKEIDYDRYTDFEISQTILEVKKKLMGI